MSTAGSTLSLELEGGHGPPAHCLAKRKKVYTRFKPLRKTRSNAKGPVMTRWLWALLAAVVLIGLGVFFWSTSNQTNPPPAAQAPASAPSPAAQAPAPAPRPPPKRRLPRRGPPHKRQLPRPSLPLKRRLPRRRPPHKRQLPRHSGRTGAGPAPSPPLGASSRAGAHRTGANSRPPARNKFGDASWRFGIPRQ